MNNKFQNEGRESNRPSSVFRGGNRIRVFEPCQEISIFIYLGTRSVRLTTDQVITRNSTTPGAAKSYSLLFYILPMYPL